MIYMGIWASLCIILGFMARRAVFAPPQKHVAAASKGPAATIEGQNQQIWEATRPK
jgi:hypothetical protein